MINSCYGNGFSLGIITTYTAAAAAATSATAAATTTTTTATTTTFSILQAITLVVKPQLFKVPLHHQLGPSIQTHEPVGAETLYMPVSDTKASILSWGSKT